VIPTEEGNITKSGLYIPDSAKDNQRRGKIIAVNEKSSLNVGDEILYLDGSYGSWSPDNCILVPEDRIFAIINND